MKRAPEPTDVYWENLSVTFVTKIKKVAMTYMATIVVIGVCFAVTYGMKLGSESLKGKQKSMKLAGSTSDNVGSFVKYIESTPSDLSSAIFSQRETQERMFQLL